MAVNGEVTMKKIKSIIIVGGGSSGWMAASYLNKVLMAESGISITVIESPDIETIGVGEATVPTIRNFFQKIGLPEKELIRETNATIKSAIKFVDWFDRGEGDSYYHPFEAPLYSDGIEVSAHWAAEKIKGNTVEKFANATGVIPDLCDAQKVTNASQAKDYSANTLYAYHLDAVLMASYLRKKSIERGVVRVEDTVTAVNQNDRGEITSVNTANAGEHTADFFIDCTGFSSLLIEKTLKEKFISYEDELPCNSAVAIQTPYTDESSFPPPFTTATAKSAGWIWEIGLSSRKGNGYVFSDKFQSFDQAESELRQHLGESANGLTAKKLKMRVGRRENSWSKNCLAVGLSSGFLEPLESTGLQFIQVALELFVDYFPSVNNYAALQKQFNQVLAAKYEDSKDFIVAHYCLTAREDTDFWRHMKHESKISDSLQHQLALWKHKLPSHSDLKEIGLFSAPNYMYILAGLNSLAHETLSKESDIPSQRSKQVLQQMQKIRQGAVKVSGSHQSYIKGI